MMPKNRSKEEIIADILSVVRTEPKKTHIMYGANLSYALLCKYLDMLFTGGLISYREHDEVYTMTAKGNAYLAKYVEFERLKSQLEAAHTLLKEQEASLAEILESAIPLFETKQIPLAQKISRYKDDD